jgi:endoglucanase
MKIKDGISLEFSADRDDIVRQLTVLTEATGPSGLERDVVNLIQNELDLTEGAMDAMGNLVASFGPKDAEDRILFLAHTDEVSYVVTAIDESGSIFAAPNGLLLPAVAAGSFVQVLGRQGSVSGAVLAPPAHLVTAFSEASPGIWIHVGASDRDAVRRAGIQVGDPVCYKTPFHRLIGSRVAGKSLDNRAGCVALIQLGRLLARSMPTIGVDLAFTVQEEIGSRGAEVVVRRLNPTIAVVVDTVSACDDVYVSFPRGTARLGMGPTIRSFDLYQGGAGLGTRGVAYSRRLSLLAGEVAESRSIPFQRDAAATWTDAAWACSSLDVAVPTLGLFIPRLSSHSPLEVIDLRDLEACLSLCAGIVDKVQAVGKHGLDKPW